jgi:hypothetical protein
LNTLSGYPELFFLERNLPKVNPSVFWTMDSFFGPAFSRQPLKNGQSFKFSPFSSPEYNCDWNYALNRLICTLHCDKKATESDEFKKAKE